MAESVRARADAGAEADLTLTPTMMMTRHTSVICRTPMPMQVRRAERGLVTETGTERERTTKRQRVYRQFHATTAARATTTSAAVELLTMLPWVTRMSAVTLAASAAVVLAVAVAVVSAEKTPCLPREGGVKAECDKHTPMRRAVGARRMAVSPPLCASATTTVVDPLRPFSCEEVVWVTGK